MEMWGVCRFSWEKGPHPLSDPQSTLWLQKGKSHWHVFNTLLKNNIHIGEWHVISAQLAGFAQTDIPKHVAPRLKSRTLQFPRSCLWSPSYHAPAPSCHGNPVPWVQVGIKLGLHHVQHHRNVPAISRSKYRLKLHIIRPFLLGFSCRTEWENHFNAFQTPPCGSS